MNKELLRRFEECIKLLNKLDFDKYAYAKCSLQKIKSDLLNILILGEKMKKVLNTKDMNITTSDYIKVEDKTPKIEKIDNTDKFINTLIILVDLLIAILVIFALIALIGILVG